LISPEWEDRYYSYNASWSPGEEMASMRDGSGDEWFLLFAGYGAALKGYAHELPNAHSEAFSALIRQGMPKEFASFLNEPAFGMERATFCLWRRVTDEAWSAVHSEEGSLENGEDGSVQLLSILDGTPQTYLEWAEEYYEQEVDPGAVQAIYAHTPLNKDLVRRLNPDLSFSEAVGFAKEIGYPVQKTWIGGWFSR
ncbi:MAG TPA: hypothetical protein PK760_04840, partial [Flavobacteriales bacterium]|nr:hypothetical protein [Flavobacteriales bacterium]